MRPVFLRFGSQETKGGIGTDDCTTESDIPDEAVDIDRHPCIVIDRLPQRTDECARLIMEWNCLVGGFGSHNRWACLVCQPSVRDEHNRCTEHVQEHTEK